METIYIRPEQAKLILELDSKHFGEEQQVSLEATEKRLNMNPKTDIAVLDKEALVGYLSILPITQGTFQKIKNRTASEQEAEEGVIPYKKPGKYVAYLSSIVVDKAKYPRFRGKFFIHYMQEHLRRLKKSGIFIEKMIAIAVSQQGAGFLKRAGFKQFKDNIYLFFYKKDGYQIIKNNTIHNEAINKDKLSHRRDFV